MLRKILNVTGARLNGLARFSSAHFKAVTLAAFLLVFGSTLGWRLYATDDPNCGCDNSWSFLFNSCHRNGMICCGSGNACIHCNCNQGLKYIIPVSAGGHTCNQPATYYSKNYSTMEAVLYALETWPSCISAADSMFQVVTISGTGTTLDCADCKQGTYNCSLTGNMDCEVGCGKVTD